MIKAYINQSEFVDALTRTYDNTNFTYEIDTSPKGKNDTICYGKV